MERLNRQSFYHLTNACLNGSFCRLVSTYSKSYNFLVWCKCSCCVTHCLQWWKYCNV